MLTASSSLQTLRAVTWTAFNISGDEVVSILFNQGQFGRLGIIIACVCMCVHVCVCECNPQPVCAITHHPSKLGAIDLDLQGQIYLKNQNFIMPAFTNKINTQPLE